jgi:miniconductance mechanosensitive channel
MNTTERDFAQFIEDWLLNLGIEAGMTQAIKMVILVVLMFIIASILWGIGQQFINRVVHRLAERTKTDVDDYLMEKGFFKKLGHIIPVVVISALAPVAFTDYPTWVPYIERVTDGFNILIILRAINAFINGLGGYLSSTPKYRDKPVASFTQLSKIVVWLIGLLILGAVVIGKNPLVAFTALGAASAVLLFVFKDAILGFIASIQLTVNDMIRLGDWVSLPKYHADGNIVEINLTTVKVSNWDKTISTVPTYAFVADGVTNWRGMEEGGGRRIKRSVNIKISSVKLCTDEMLERFSKIELVRDHISNRRQEIEVFNKEHNADTAASVVNGRRMTNLGILRAYIEAYVKRNPNINQEMTCMVRQLEPTKDGVALEVYCFSKEKAWVIYEGIQADLFDHILAVVPHFDLDVFESPASSDLNGMKILLGGDSK